MTGSPKAIGDDGVKLGSDRLQTCIQGLNAGVICQELRSSGIHLAVLDDIIVLVQGWC